MKKYYFGVFLVTILYVGYYIYSFFLSSESIGEGSPLIEYTILGLNAILILGLMFRVNAIRKINIFLLCLCVLFAGATLLLSLFTLLVYVPSELSDSGVLIGLGLHIVLIAICCWIISIFSDANVKSLFITNKNI
jgi:hypothetical protein